MRFSIAKLIVATLLINIVVCLTFAAPLYIGFPILTFVSLVILPPAMIVGVVNTRGVRQAFFLGCMFSGLCHFVISIYVGAIYAFDVSALSDIESEPLRYVHLIGYTIGIIGGLSGVGMYYLVTMGQKKDTKIAVAEEETQADGGNNKPVTDPFADEPNEVVEESFQSPVPR